jgi:hypothetical protein
VVREKSAEINFKIDTGCGVPLVITQDLANKLELPITGEKEYRVPSGVAAMQYSDEPVSISFTTGRNSVRTFISPRTVIGTRNLLGKSAMQFLRMTLPEGASEGIVYIFELDDDTIG